MDTDVSKKCPVIYEICKIKDYNKEKQFMISLSLKGCGMSKYKKDVNLSTFFPI